MIVLDENLLGLRLDDAIAAWYPGRVCAVTDLRSHTVIKDEAIPYLLLRLKGPTFVTTNGDDFWKRTRAHARYCIVCVSLPNERLREVPTLLRQLLRFPEFRTKAVRMGKVIRVGRQQIQYYSSDANLIKILRWSG